MMREVAQRLRTLLPEGRRPRRPAAAAATQRVTKRTVRKRPLEHDGFPERPRVPVKKTRPRLVAARKRKAKASPRKKKKPPTDDDDDDDELQ